MKSLRLLILIIPILMLSCEANNPLEEITAEDRNFAANVYFEPLSPIAFVGNEVECVVEYWSKGDEFQSIELLEEVNVMNEIKLSIEGVSYEYQYEMEEEKQERTSMAQVNHNYGNWVPDKNAYVTSNLYPVPASFKKVVLTQSNTDVSDFTDEIPEEATTDLIKKLASDLSKEDMKIVLVDVHGQVTEQTFESYYDQEGILTSDGRTQVENELSNIGVEALLGDAYSYSKTHVVGLTYKIVNGFGTEAESVTRAININ